MVMRMGDKRTKFVRGMTLLEVLVATIVISVSAAGILSYEYHAAGQAKIASVYADAVRIGNFLLDDWKANGGSTQYANNVATLHRNSDMKFVSAGAGVYRFTVNGIPMQVNLSRLDGTGYQRLVPLRVAVRWRKDFKNFTSPASAVIVIGNTTIAQPVVLNTLARVDQAGG